MKFTKAHGLGNDFIILDGRTNAGADYTALAQKLCHRQTGIGADGLLIIEDSETCCTRMRIINSDGSEAEMCGNGIRCFAKYVYERGIVGAVSFSVETLAGVMRPELHIDENGGVSAVRVNMGKPGLLAKDVPVVTDAPDQSCIGGTLAAVDGTFSFTAVRMGVPHTAVFVDDAAGFAITKYGPAIERAAIFPEGTNVNFVQVVDEHNIVMRTFERGCGCTLACGTGACGSVVACVLNGRTARKVNVHIQLGTMQVEWDEDGTVYMTGPAELVFDGAIEI